MIRVVADASIAVKWAFPFRDDEADGERAIALLDGFQRGEVDLLEPPHWLAEVAAVISRQAPAAAPEHIDVLYALRIPIADNRELYAVACQLAAVTGQHVFDTLYHAVALTMPDRVLVTADERYYKKAGQAGSIALLRNFNPSEPESR